MALNILLVDDSLTVRSVLSKTLQMADLDVGEILQATNGREALDILAKRWVDLVLADINMPVMNGIEMIERMATDRLLETIPVIVVSTEGSATRIEHLKAKGVRAWIRKPFSAEVIRDVVLNVLDSAATGTPAEPGGYAALVGRVTCDVLAKSAYLFAQPAGQAEPPPGDGPLWETSIAFKGPLTGTLELLVPDALAREIAVSILGAREGAPVAVGDALAELTNVACGHVLTSLAGVGAVFEMALPAAREAGPNRWDELASEPDSVRLAVDAQALLVRLTLGGVDA